MLFNLISIIDYIEENMPLNIATVKTESSQANYKITITLSHGSFLAVYSFEIKKAQNTELHHDNNLSEE